MRRVWVLLAFLFCQFCVSAQNWQTLDGTPNKYLNCFYDDSATGKLFVAGTYSLIGGNDYRGIATWNGVAWDSLGAGIDDNFSTFPGNTHCVTRFGNDILIGGVFSKVGNITAKGMARWDGNQWSSMFGGQPTGAVSDIKIYNNELYVCGSFDSIGTSLLHCISKWNGTTWEAIGQNYDFNGSISTSGSLSSMSWYHGNLYVAGMFRDPWGTLCRLAKWNGSYWQFMVSEVQGSIAYIDDMIVYNDELYVSGLFYETDGNIATSIKRWNDTLWRDVGGSVTVVNNIYPEIKDMCVHNGKLYCAGSFEQIGGIDAHGIASWDGTDWCGYNTNFELTPGQYMGAGCIGFYNDTMYVGGGFRWVDGDSIPYLAKWVAGNFVDTCGNTTGIFNHSDGHSIINVYPNPAIESATFIFDKHSQRTITISDVTGRVIRCEQSNDSHAVISLENMSPGLYLYTVQESGNHTYSGKLVVQ